MSFYSVQEMYCTVCGTKYSWTCNHGFPKSRACCMECHEEWAWRETLSIMGTAYYPRPSEAAKHLEPAKV
jgi:hypothetical protein